MNTNILDYMYEGYGYDMDNQLLYCSVERYNTALDKDGYSDNGMKTFASNDIDILTHGNGMAVFEANEYTEIGQFLSEEGPEYTDLRQGKCRCGKCQ